MAVVGTAAAMQLSGAGERGCALRLTLMRGFELSCCGQAIQLPRSAQRLIAFLALNERPMLRSYAAAMLWLDSTEAHSGGSLRTTLWRLRRPGHHLVELHGPSLNLTSELVVDVRRLAAIARRLAHGGYELDQDELEELLAGGELLPGWYEDWVIMERERTRQLHVQSLESASEVLAGAGRYAEAAALALAAVEAEPLRESAHRGVIRTHIASGNRADAFRQYERYVSILRAELGLGPSPEMSRLMETLRGSSLATDHHQVTSR